MRDDIAQRFGEDAARALDHLFAIGTMDDCLARQYVVKTTFTQRLTDTERDVKQVCNDMGEDYGMTPQRVWQIVSGYKMPRKQRLPEGGSVG